MYSVNVTGKDSLKGEDRFINETNKKSITLF